MFWSRAIISRLGGLSRSAASSRCHSNNGPATAAAAIGPIPRSGGDQGATHFGFQTIDESEKEEKVHKVFEEVAQSYDLMNDAMSAGIHRLWKDTFIERLGPGEGTRLLDMAGGTGEFFVQEPANSIPSSYCDAFHQVTSHSATSTTSTHALRHPPPAHRPPPPPLPPVT